MHIKKADDINDYESADGRVDDYFWNVRAYCCWLIIIWLMGI